MWAKWCNDQSDQRGAQHTKGWPCALPLKPILSLTMVAGNDPLLVCECEHIPHCEHAHARTHTHTDWMCSWCTTHNVCLSASSAVCSWIHMHIQYLHTHTPSHTGERSTVTHFWQSGEEGTNIIMQAKFSSWMHAAEPEGSYDGTLGSYSLLALLLCKCK